MDTMNAYYNAKPSNISNIGADVSGAKRMHFDTYETDAEKEVRERKKALDNGLKVIKEQLKAEILSAVPNRELISKLLNQQFSLAHGLEYDSPESRSIIQERRNAAVTRESIAEFNKMIRAMNGLRRDLRAVQSDYYFKLYILKMRARYQPKHSFVEQTGKTFNWKDFTTTENVTEKIDYLKTNAKAVQFGNSVSDKERGYILVELTKFLKDWSIVEGLNNIDLSPVAWSFGARGKAGSVAYYQNANKLISVNRNNVGSLIHEIGHFIDAVSGNVSNSMSYEAVAYYRNSIKDQVAGTDLKYYCQRCEIFARAFEAYCFSIYAGFSEFAQCGKDYLPELTDELRGLVEKALNFKKEA